MAAKLTATGPLDTLQSVEGASTAPPGRLDRVLLGVALVWQSLTWWLATTPVALDPDAPEVVAPAQVVIRAGQAYDRLEHLIEGHR